MLSPLARHVPRTASIWIADYNTNTHLADGADPAASVRPLLRCWRRGIPRPCVTTPNQCGRHTALVDNGREHSFTTATVEYCSWSGVPRSMENAEKWVKGERGDGSGIHGVRSGRGGIVRTRRRNAVAGTVVENGRTPNAVPSRAHRTPGDRRGGALPSRRTDDAPPPSTPPNASPWIPGDLRFRARSVRVWMPTPGSSHVQYARTWEDSRQLYPDCPQRGVRPNPASRLRASASSAAHARLPLSEMEEARPERIGGRGGPLIVSRWHTAGVVKKKHGKVFGPRCVPPRVVL